MNKAKPTFAALIDKEKGSVKIHMDGHDYEFKIKTGQQERKEIINLLIHNGFIEASELIKQQTMKGK